MATQKQSENPAESAEDPARQTFVKNLVEHLRAGYQCLYIVTSEEARLEADIANAAKQQKHGVITWDIADRFSSPEGAQAVKYSNPMEALRAIGSENDPFGKGSHVFVFRDLDDFFNEPGIRRVIRTLCEGNKLVNTRFKRPLIITSPVLNIHPKLKSCITVLEYSLPDEARLHKTLNFVQRSITSENAAKASFTEDLREQIVSSLRGLTSTEAENALARCVVKHEGFAPEMLTTIKDEKAAIIKKSEVLTYIKEEQQADRSAIGGFENLLKFIDRRRLAYTKDARAINLDFPKGVVLVGVPGTGKSLVAKAVCKLLGLPGYIMDVGSVFGSLVGESEQRMRDALKQVEAQQGCVLVLDEVDKAFGGATDSQGDSGVTRRVFGQLLTWLAEKKDRTFVMMTLNRTKGIPPEFLRAGRFDAVFYTDLPHEKEREDIIKIHMRLRGIDPDNLGLGPNEWAELVSSTKNFVGSELEELVRDSRYLSFEKRQSGMPNFAEIMEAKGSVIPLATLDSEGVQSIRDWCKDRARPVSSPPKKAPAARREQRSVDVSGSNDN